LIGIYSITNLVLEYKKNEGTKTTNLFYYTNF
jgi:hypothetical protein